jgi:pyruvyltransferase
LILLELTGRQIVWAQLGQEDVVCVGSMLDAYTRDGGQGLILGTGVRNSAMPFRDFPVSRVLGVRGLDSARIVGVGAEAAIGDPGLLISEIVPGGNGRSGPPAFIPHLRMFGSTRGHTLIRAFAAKGFTIIPPNSDPVDVARSVSTASSVLATSLHALVFADSYGVPCARLEVPWLREPLFKFGDYRSVFDVGLASFSIAAALSGADVREVADEERGRIAEQLHGVLQRIYTAAAPLRT